ncbi:uncharacterized protein PHACADRAFT_179078 [Phanerochaete carnosa HHB-10118-sp]|uniref:G domain-containing protein n=1 Tax=Phanerochaete carnosa (strain HHB-10118-sp) TaxID=650164 RepID=K5VSC8_PHACS|nr:uncharacterized protein PHACADRAFT_179078 [Phanerochaete carnosa HHB-10118-sp]EKM49680.1 hypothetical protein PHACADRAFT_179078 [Phanerochaete carnosa HHB-10118-sp]
MTRVTCQVCGENVADQPSTTRGVHDIERELIPQRNDKIVAHDSEGFEAGQGKEVKVVSDFIARRAATEDINERLHMVWYCVEINSRPIQQAEREFFSTMKEVPVIAVMTKFDTYVQDVLQELEEAAEKEGRGVDEDELETQATQTAESRFKEHYCAPLQALLFPPKAVVALSHTHKSEPSDSRLTELIRQTMDALEPPQDSEVIASRHEEQRKLRELFATAQTVDVALKIEHSICLGMGENYGSLGERPISRERLLEPWNTVWSKEHDEQLFKHLDRRLQDRIDFSFRLIGHPESDDWLQIRRWNSPKLKFCAQLEQMVIDTVIIMKHIFLLHIEHLDVAERLIEWYDSRSATAQRVRQALVDVHNRNRTAIVGLSMHELYRMVNSLQFEAPDITLESMLPAPPPLVPLPSVRPLVAEAETRRDSRLSLVAKLFKKAEKQQK